MRKSAWLLKGLFLITAGRQARADIPPPPETLGKYTVTVNADISALLLDATRFDKKEVVKIQFGKIECETYKHTWISDERQISCLESTWCYGKKVPQCTVKLTTSRNAQVLTVESIDPVTDASNGAAPVPVHGPEAEPL